MLEIFKSKAEEEARDTPGITFFHPMNTKRPVRGTIQRLDNTVGRPNERSESKSYY